MRRERTLKTSFEWPPPCTRLQLTHPCAHGTCARIACTQAQLKDLEKEVDSKRLEMQQQGLDIQQQLEAMSVTDARYKKAEEDMKELQEKLNAVNIDGEEKARQQVTPRPHAQRSLAIFTPALHEGAECHHCSAPR